MLTGRRAAGVLIALVLALHVLTGCGSDDSSAGSSRSASTPPSASLSVVPAPTTFPTFDPQARIPLGAQTAPEDFPGDDEHFLAVARGILVSMDTEAPAADPQLVTAAREICSLLSGGGAVASKLDMYAGQRDYADKGWTAVIFGAIQEYCPELGPGYFADRRGPLPMSSAEQLDLFRYAIRTGLGVEQQISDQEIEKLAAQVCHKLSTDPDHLLQDLNPNADRPTFVTIFAAIVAFCPGDGHVLDELMDDLA